MVYWEKNIGDCVIVVSKFLGKKMIQDSVAKFPMPLGGYTLTRLISRGGMASVYEGRRESIAGVSPRVAIKMILPEKSKDPTYKELFVSEAKVSSNLMHRNLVHIQDFDEIDGMFFLVMEYVEGATLRDTIRLSSQKNRVIPYHVICEIGRQICEGLHHAHQATTVEGRPLGLVHCDIKPSNVIVSSQGTIKILDFGVSQAVVSKTNGRAMRGTWGYMPVEQANGEVLTPRTDLFSVGVLLYEMVALKPMFSREEKSDPKTMKQLLASDEPVKRVLALNLPNKNLKECMVRVLQRDPSARFATGDDMAKFLGKLVPDPVVAVADLTALMARVEVLKKKVGHRALISPLGEKEDFSGISIQKRPLPVEREDEERRKFVFWFLLLFPLILAGGFYGISKLLSSESTSNEPVGQQESIEESKEELKEEPKEIEIVEETKSSGSFEEFKEPKDTIKPKTNRTNTRKKESSAVRITPEIKDPPKEKVENKTDISGDGIITIAADKAATVFIDGKKIKAAPLFKYKLSAGEHRIHIATPTGQIKKFSVNIADGDSLMYQWSFADSKWIRNGK